MKLAIRVTDPGNDAKWNFLWSALSIAVCALKQHN